MSIESAKKQFILRCVLRLVRRNSNAFHLMSSTVKGLWNGNLSKQLVSRVFEIDPRSELPAEDLVAEALLNGLSEEDIEDIFRRYAKRKGLDF